MRTHVGRWLKRGEKLIRDLFSKTSGVVYGTEEAQIDVDTYRDPDAATNGQQDVNYSGIDVPIFICPIDKERKVVYHYDPQHPPRCKSGHIMEPADELE